MKKGFLVSILLLLLTQSFVYARIRLNVKFISKSNVDQGLIMTDEIHSMKDITSDEPIILQLKNDIKLEIHANMINAIKDQGPYPAVALKARLFSLKNGFDDLIDDVKVITHMGEKAFIERKQDKKRSFEIIISPEII